MLQSERLESSTISAFVGWEATSFVDGYHTSAVAAASSNRTFHRIRRRSGGYTCEQSQISVMLVQVWFDDKYPHT
jgi:hypothetical protein